MPIGVGAIYCVFYQTVDNITPFYLKNIKKLLYVGKGGVYIRVSG